VTWLLALDTAGTEGSITLARFQSIDADEPLALEEVVLDVRQRHAQVLLPAIGELLVRVGVAARDVGVIAVTSGPGSFTGLRVGIMCAKTWAYACGATLVAIPSLWAIASTVRDARITAGPVSSQGPNWPGHLVVTENAQRGEVFVSRFLAEPPSTDEAFLTESQSAIGIETAASVVQGLPASDLLTGPGATLCTGFGAGLDLGQIRTESRPSGETLARLGVRLARLGQASNPLTLEPIYLRRSSAEDKWLARQAELARASATT
jgi:tRNA threonylcarbamoyladenosine biosynthesis protein TsaB